MKEVQSSVEPVALRLHAPLLINHKAKFVNKFAA